jgi:NAD(P)-dependent dehydrogenase (short-subunit alcohol dehydrogenase family)
MVDPEKKQALADKHLLGLGECADISNACIYLLSDASKWVTGQNLIVDGGYTTR